MLAHLVIDERLTRRPEVDRLGGPRFPMSSWPTARTGQEKQRRFYLFSPACQLVITVNRFVTLLGGLRMNRKRVPSGVTSNSRTWPT